MSSKLFPWYGLREQPVDHPGLFILSLHGPAIVAWNTADYLVVIKVKPTWSNGLMKSYFSRNPGEINKRETCFHQQADHIDPPEDLLVAPFPKWM